MREGFVLLGGTILRWWQFTKLRRQDWEPRPRIYRVIFLLLTPAILCPMFTLSPCQWAPLGVSKLESWQPVLGMTPHLRLLLCIVIPGRRDSKWFCVDHTGTWHLHQGTYPCGCVVRQPTGHGRVAANSRQRNAQGQIEWPPWPCVQWVQTRAVFLAGVLGSTLVLDLK